MSHFQWGRPNESIFSGVPANLLLPPIPAAAIQPNGALFSNASSVGSPPTVVPSPPRRLHSQGSGASDGCVQQQRKNTLTPAATLTR